MLSDAELLQRYAAEKSEPAFAELVWRYLDLVYSAALRQVGGDAHRAEDVAQVVFTTLARKAGSLARHPVLAGWLYTATRHAAAKAMRAEWRRKAREKEAQAMLPTESDEEDIDWERVRPVLDDAMGELDERDREAVLLRFFAQRPFGEIGTALHLSEDAARMRVERALDKLHGLLARRGVTSTAAALAISLTQHGTMAAPGGLAVVVTGAAMAGGASSAIGASLVSFMASGQASVGALTMAAGLLALNLMQHEANVRSRARLDALAREIRVLQPLREENRNLASQATALVADTADAAELARLRARAAELQRKFAARRPSLWVGGRPVMPDMPPEEKLEIIYREGRSTPMRAWQTLQETGTEQGRLLRHEEMMDLHALMFCLDPAGRERAEAFLATLPAGFRQAFPTAERLLAPVFDQWLWRGDRPLGFAGNGRDTFIDGDSTRAYTHWRVTYASGRTKAERFPFQRFDDGWRYGPLSVSEVEQMLSWLEPTTGRPKSPPVSVVSRP